MPANASISYSSSQFADIIGACLMVVSHVAHAAPPPDADMSLAPWFHSLTIPNTGSSCCGAADCRNYPVVVASDGYRVQFRGQWLKVPPAVVQDRWDNPTGDYVTCIIDAAEPEVLCFIKAPRTSYLCTVILTGWPAGLVKINYLRGGEHAQSRMRRHGSGRDPAQALRCRRLGHGRASRQARARPR